MRPRLVFGVALIALGVGIADASLLGPLAAGAIDYHVSEDLENQVVGGDAVALVLIAPLAVVAGVLALRGHPAAPALALGLGLFAAYLYAQYIVGAEYFRYEGNSERFFPLFLALFVGGAGIALRAWALTGEVRLPSMTARGERLLAGLLVLIAAFLLFGLHLPGLLDAWSDEPTRTEYVNNPTAFWIVKWMDLGIVVPAALAAAYGLLRSAAWAQRATYAIVGWFALLGSAVAGMALVMLARDDPDASVANAAVFTVFAAVLLAIAARMYWPMLRRPSSATPRAEPSRA